MTLKDKIYKIKQLRENTVELDGIFTVFNPLNNRRIYPQDVFDREIKKLNEKAQSNKGLSTYYKR